MHTGEAVYILAERKALYERAKAQRPDRWISDNTRNWTPARETWITPPSSELLERKDTA